MAITQPHGVGDGVRFYLLLSPLPGPCWGLSHEPQVEVCVLDPLGVLGVGVVSVGTASTWKGVGPELQGERLQGSCSLHGTSELPQGLHLLAMRGEGCLILSGRASLSQIRTGGWHNPWTFQAWKRDTHTSPGLDPDLWVTSANVHASDSNSCLHLGEG